jgi:hypothetical protein
VIYTSLFFYGKDKNIFLKSGSRKWIGFGEVGKVEFKNGDKIISIDSSRFRKEF